MIMINALILYLETKQNNILMSSVKTKKYSQARMLKNNN